VVSDTLSVISLCLLYTLPLNAILLSICAICSNIPELGSWKGFVCSYYKQVSFYAGPMSEKGCGNQNSANQTKNFHLKLYFCGVRGLALILHIVQLYHYGAYRPVDYIHTVYRVDVHFYTVYICMYTHPHISKDYLSFFPNTTWL
jgi:hypothetical protein